MIFKVLLRKKGIQALMLVIGICIVCFLTVPREKEKLQLPDVTFAELTTELSFWQDYEGYLDDETLSEMEFYADFQNTDYDGDGIADRVYRRLEGENVSYSIEFGKGTRLDFAMAGRLNWIHIIAEDLNGDGSNEIIFEGNYYVDESGKTVNIYPHPFAFYTLSGKKYKKMDVPVSAYGSGQGKEILGYDFYYNLKGATGVLVSCPEFDYSTEWYYTSTEIRQSAGYVAPKEGENVCSGYSGEIRYCTYEGKPAIIYADYLTKSTSESEIFACNKVYTVLTFEGNRAVCQWIGEKYQDHIESQLNETERWIVNGEILSWSSKECEADSMPPLDVDFDGVTEKIGFSLSGNSYEISVGDQTVRGTGEKIEDALIAMAFDHNCLYLAVVDHRSETSKTTTLYTYENNYIYNVGTIPFDVREANHIEDSKTISGTMLLDMIWQTEVTVNATLGETGKNIETEKNYYINSPHLYDVELKEPIFVYSRMDSSSIGFYLEPQLLTFDATDGRNWICVSGQYGRTGWLRMDDAGRLIDSGNVVATDIMEKLEDTHQDAYGNHMVYNRYTGYLDEPSMVQNIYVKSPYDIDEDGQTDRIYKGQSADGKTYFRIEFGNGDVLETESVNSSYVCDWKAMDLTGDNVPEIVCNYYTQTMNPYNGLMDIGVYIKAGKTYERLDTPRNPDGKFGYDIRYRRQDDTTIYAFCEETGFEFTFELKLQERNSNYFKESGSWVYHLYDTVRPGKWNGRNAMVFQQILDGGEFEKSIYSVVTFENGAAKCQWMGTAKQYAELDGKADMMADYNRFQNYTGYMDQFASGMIWHYVYMPDDVDGDGKKDRIYRTLSGANAIYRVEFGDGAVLLTSPVPKATVCQWSTLQLTGDEQYEIVCCFTYPFSSAPTVKDIQLFEKKDKSYEMLVMPKPSPSINSSGDMPLTGYDIGYEVLDSGMIRIYHEESGFSQEFLLSEELREYYHLSKQGIWQFSLFDDMGRTLWQGKPAFYFRQLLGGKNFFEGIYVIVTFENGAAKCQWMGTNPDTLEKDGTDGKSGMQQLDEADFTSGRVVELDMDGDGDKEKVQLSIGENDYTVTIENQSLKESGKIAEDAILLVNPSDTRKIQFLAIVCLEEGEACTRFYTFVQNELISAGSVPFDLREGSIDRVNEKIVQEVEMNRVFEDVALVTWNVNYNEYMIQEEAEPIYALKYGEKKWVKYHASSVCLYDEPDVLSENWSVSTKEVTFLYTDLRQWFYIQCQDGSRGWFQITEDGRIPSVWTYRGSATVTEVFINGFAGDKFE